jgi:hypothetical protein
MEALSACGGSVGESLGMGKRAPDEFQVVRRAPLVLPPDYALRPPQPGAAPSQQQDTAAQAQALLTGRPRPVGPTAQSAGEVALLDQSRVQANPDIRQVLVAENQDLVNLDESRFLFILGFQRRRMEQRREPVIDPVAESQRLAAGNTAGGVVTMRTGSQPIVP